MVKQDIDIKKKIIRATVELIKIHGETSKITVRDIASSAGVGIGLINYHFQTKDNLINICVLELIQHSIVELAAMDPNSKLTPIDQMKTLGQGITTFMVLNPGVSRISITKDFVTPEITDNSVQIVHMLHSIATQIIEGDKSNQALYFQVHMLVSSIEAAFLRKDVLKQAFGIDLDDAEQRNHWVDFCIDSLFSK